MTIPSNITKEYLLKAIEKIDLEGIPEYAASQYYDVSFQGKKYPPKLIVSYANLFANGSVLDRKAFPGGVGTPCFKLLNDNGFIIEKKNLSFFPQLLNFLDQIKTLSLKTTSYLKQYEGLDVKVGFGQGNQARIPWIAFLQKGNTVQNGIYPAYLFYKEKQLLILAYGVSETNKPSQKWNISNVETIQKYFTDHSIGNPERYKNSFVYKTYDTKLPLDEEEINEDLYKLLDLYKKMPMSQNETVENSNQSTNFNYQKFVDGLKEAKLHVSSKLALRLVASLLTKPFVILTGLSGSGKTKLAQAFALWICENEQQYCIVPVGADWTNREPLLGFPNALNIGEYVKPDNKVLDLITSAIENPEKPYFLILDEMNLSHVERYFADFLSVMESQGKISLHSGSDNWGDVPFEILIPKNLFIIGTVNIDETTYMFSPKVLDRASVIEFRVTADEMKNYLSSNTNLDLNLLGAKGINMAHHFVNIAKTVTSNTRNTEILNEVLLYFFKELMKTGAEFGYRSASEIIRFSAMVNMIDPEWSITEIIDAAIMQKLLPKVHGSRQKLKPVLETLATLCIMDEIKTEKSFDIETFLKTESSKNSAKLTYPVSFEKISRMYVRLLDNGFTSYAEA